ncbi:MAG: hypothetical protein ACE5HX_06415 [bacterium]
MNFKYIHQALDKTIGSGQGVDLGVLLEFQNNEFGQFTQRKFSIGLTIKDIFNTTVTWNTPNKQRDTVPLNASFGVAYAERLPWIRGTLTFSFHRDNRFESIANWGGEYSVNNFLFIRSGMQDGNFTAGVGLRISKLQVDYAFVGYDLGNTHRISGSVRF